MKGIPMTQHVYTLTHLTQEIDYLVSFHLDRVEDAVEEQVRNSFLNRLELALNNEQIPEMLNYRFRQVVIQVRRMCFAMWEAMAQHEFDFPISKIYSEVIETLRSKTK